MDSSAEGFALVMDVSCHSFSRMARLAAPPMTSGGCLLTLSFEGANRVVPDYGLMEPVKAALKTAMRYIAAKIEVLDIRAHAISPRPIKSRAARGIAHFDAKLARAAAATPGTHETKADVVGALATLLVGDGARSMTGSVIVVDNGRRMMA